MPTVSGVGQATIQSHATPASQLPGGGAGASAARVESKVAVASQLYGRDSNMVWLPPIEPWVLPRTPFESIIGQYGIYLMWAKSHVCACIYGGDIPGSPDAACTTCLGRGVYWDAPVGPFRGLITFIHMSPSPDEPGTLMSEQQGLMINGEPALTIPWNAGVVWKDAAPFDLYTETEAISRLDAQLQVGGRTVVPYQTNLTIAPQGAVTIYDNETKKVVPVTDYTVNGPQVTLGSGYPEGTNYIVDFYASPTYVAYRVAGAPAHARPFGSVAEPRRFRLQLLDLWLRSNAPGLLPQ
jgi:hypothetical protein